MDEHILSSCNHFDCGHSDLNSFFYDDSINYSRELLGKSYCFKLDEDPSVIVCAFTISNDSIKLEGLPTSRRHRICRYIPRTKLLKSYPAVLIGRLGINQEYKRRKIGSELMAFIKAWFIDPQNKTGCRFIVVDSYNDEIPINYYKKCGFEFVFSTEEQERESMHKNIPEGERLNTRSMIFDLIVLRS